MHREHFSSYDKLGYRVEVAHEGNDLEGIFYINDLYGGSLFFEEDKQEWRVISLKPDEKYFVSKQEAVEFLFDSFFRLDPSRRIRNSIIECFSSPSDFHHFVVECLALGLKQEDRYRKVMTDEVDIYCVCSELLQAWSINYRNRREEVGLSLREKRTAQEGVEFLSGGEQFRFRVNGVVQLLSKRQAIDLLWIAQVLSDDETPADRSIRLSCCHGSSLHSLHRKKLLIWQSEVPYRDVILTTEGYEVIKILRNLSSK